MLLAGKGFYDYYKDKYDEAISAFTELNGFKDSAELIDNCKYNLAVASIENGDIINAYESLIALNGYNDSAEKAKEIFGKYKKEKIKASSPGDIISFGTYEQDNKKSNGKEEIEWVVLEKKGSKVLVISRYALDAKDYYSDRDDFKWDNCPIRKWLNNSFLNNAFSDEERIMIPKMKVSADKDSELNTNAGKSTNDQVFLLSMKEADKYFISDEARQCVATAYAIAKGSDAEEYMGEYDDWKKKFGNCYWWLRSPGSIDDGEESVYDHYTAYVNENGYVEVDNYTMEYEELGVRPALWIDPES